MHGKVQESELMGIPSWTSLPVLPSPNNWESPIQRRQSSEPPTSSPLSILSSLTTYRSQTVSCPSDTIKRKQINRAIVNMINQKKTVELICESKMDFYIASFHKEEAFDQIISDDSQISTTQQTHATQILLTKRVFFCSLVPNRTYEFSQIETYIYIYIYIV